MSSELEQIQAGIASLEAQRTILGDGSEQTRLGGRLASTPESLRVRRQKDSFERQSARPRLG